MKNKFLIAILALFTVVAGVFGVGQASWAYTSNQANDNSIHAKVPEWHFLVDNDFAKMDNLGNISNLTAAQETTLTQNSNEAIRFTNVSGTSGKDHIFNINLDRDYNLYDIATCKIEFDYHHRYKREQYNKGFPSVQLYYNSTARGSAQGGGDTITNISPFTVTDIDENWWHLEYYITSMCPTICDHQDKPQSNYKINSIRFNDKGVWDYADTTAFMVIDNLVFTNEPGARLGLFNRTAGDTVGKYFWFKVAWSGDLHSCVLTTSDSSIAVPDTESTKSPFYVHLLAAGRVTITATVEIGSNHQIFTISNTITVS